MFRAFPGAQAIPVSVGCSLGGWRASRPSGYRAPTIMEPQRSRAPSPLRPPWSSTLDRARAALRPIRSSSIGDRAVLAGALLWPRGAASASAPRALLRSRCCCSRACRDRRRRFPLGSWRDHGVTIVQLALPPEGQGLTAGLASSWPCTPSASASSAGRHSPDRALGRCTRHRLRGPGRHRRGPFVTRPTERSSGLRGGWGRDVGIRRRTRARRGARARLERERDERAGEGPSATNASGSPGAARVVYPRRGAIVIQAGGALRVIDKRPDEARPRRGDRHDRAPYVTDMRWMLGHPGRAGDVGLDARPLPPDELWTSAVRQGCRGLVIEGEARRWTWASEGSVYPDHPGGARRTRSSTPAVAGARVVVRHLTDALEIEIRNDRGSGTPADLEPQHEGRGLIGMRERATMLRGTLMAHTTATGFLVTARLPIDGAGSAI